MATYFSFRLINLERYRQLEPVFQALTAQHLALPEIEAPLREALVTMESAEFQKLNHESDLLRTWSSLIQKALNDSWQSELHFDDDQQLMEILIATLCMPEFQFYYTSISGSISRNCFYLGQWDHGLLLSLRQHNAWFDSLFNSDFPFEYGKYVYGSAMAILNRKQLNDLVTALRETAPLLTENPDLLACLGRFYDLATRVIERPDFTLVISME